MAALFWLFAAVIILTLAGVIFGVLMLLWDGIDERRQSSRRAGRPAASPFCLRPARRDIV